jgi:hypothetical protein
LQDQDLAFNKIDFITVADELSAIAGIIRDSRE